MLLILTALISIIAASNSNPVQTKKAFYRLTKEDEEFCNSLIPFNDMYYRLEETKNILGIPADINVNWKSGKVFFTLISEEMKMSLQVMNQDDIETLKVAGLGQSTAVDNLNDILYLATDNGVYKHKEDGSIELYSALGEDVMYLAISSDGSVMYIATWPQNRVHKITNEGQTQESFPYIPNGHGITIDTRNNIFFIATKTSYVLKADERVPIKIKGLPKERMTRIFVSRSDEVYGMDENSNVYRIDPDLASAKFVGSFSINKVVNSFAMDGADNFLIGVQGAILKFAAYDSNPCLPRDKLQRVISANNKRRKQKKRKTTTTESNSSDEEEEEETTTSTTTNGDKDEKFVTGGSTVE